MRILNDLALKNKTAYPKLSLGGGFLMGLLGFFLGGLMIFGIN